MRRKDGKRSLDDLKRIIMAFRIDELQTLLSYCGINLYPRYRHKHELIARAKNLLINEGSQQRELATAKILELYNQRYGVVSPPHDKSYASAASVSGTAPSIAATFLHAPAYIPFSNNNKDKDPSTYLNYQKQYSTQQVSQRPSNISSAISSSNIHDPRLYEARAVQPSSSITLPIHPDVQFMLLPFYDVIDILIKPTSLQPRMLSGPQDTNLVYHLTPYQTQLITNSRSYMNTIVEYAVQVQLRFCLNETSCVQEDLYPTRCKIVVNGKGIPLPGQPPPTAKNQEPRKPHRPVNITSLCRLSPMQSNQIQVQWMPSDLGQRYAATVQLVKTVQPETLIQKLSNKPIRSEAHTIAFIKEKLSPDPDSEVAMTSLKVSLCCPIGRTKMNMPCRANKCKHLQCFDGSTYIQMNECKPSWVCPVCDQKAHYDDLFQDGLFTKIISEAVNCEDIVFYEDGSWRSLEDIQLGQDGARPLAAEALATPKPTNSTTKLPTDTPKPSTNSPKCSNAPKPTNTTPKLPNKTVIACETPPVTSITSNITSKIPNLPNPSPQSTIPPLSTIKNSSTSEQGSSEVELSESSKTNEQEQEEEIEVITIDDSDSDSEDVNTTTSNSNMNGGQRRSTEAGPSVGMNVPFAVGPDLQALELYHILTQGDRVAPPMYMEQNSLMSQLSNNSQQALDNNDVIDISDE